jgi:hypothetical protein
MRRSILGVGTIAGLCLASAAGSALAAAPLSPSAAPPVPAWSAPERILDGAAGTVSMAVGEDGAVHAAVSTYEAVWYVTDRTGDWTSRAIVVNDNDGNLGHVYYDPSLALDDDGRVHVALIRNSSDPGTGCDCNHGIFLTSDEGRAAGTFGAPTRLVKGNAHAPSLKVHDGSIYLAYRKGFDTPADPGYYDGEVWLKTNAGGTWRTTLVAGDLETQPPDPSLRVNDRGKPRIAWADDGIYVASAIYRFGGFQRERVPGTTGGDTLPVLSLDSAGKPQVAFLRARPGTARDGTMLARRGGTGWSVSRVTNRSGVHALSLDTSDAAHVVVGARGGGLFAYAAPGFGEETLSSATVRSLAFRVPSVGDPIVLFTSSKAPRGLYVTRD